MIVKETSVAVNACVLALLTLSLAQPALARNEAWYQDRHCEGATEHVLADRTRVDCLTDTHATEYDWGPKWAEGVGQALGYAMQTGRRAGIVLILERRSHQKHWRKLNAVIEEYSLPIDTWAIEAWKREAP